MSVPDEQVEGLMRLMEGEHVGPFNLGNPGEFTMLELAQVNWFLNYIFTFSSISQIYSYIVGRTDMKFKSAENNAI
mgnify:CR=1 FL=1